MEVNPKDSMTGKYAFKLKMGVPAIATKTAQDEGQELEPEGTQKPYT